MWRDFKVEIEVSISVTRVSFRHLLAEKSRRTLFKPGIKLGGISMLRSLYISSLGHLGKVCLKSDLVGYMSVISSFDLKRKENCGSRD